VSDDPLPERIEVVLLGTYHMADPGLDAVDLPTDDVLSDRRQAELSTLADDLAAAAPDRVAVEYPAAREAALNRRYRPYRSGDRAYDEPAPSAADGDDVVGVRNEVVQVGFRLAERLGHERVHPVDVPASLGNDDLAALRDRGVEPTPRTAAERTDLDDHRRRFGERLADSSIPAFLAWLNDPRRLGVNHEHLFGDYLPLGEGSNYGGPDALATWYRRNLRIAHNVCRAAEPGDERLLLVVGSGHVRALDHLLGETPGLAPVDPLPYLPDPGE